MLLLQSIIQTSNCGEFQLRRTVWRLLFWKKPENVLLILLKPKQRTCTFMQMTFLTFKTVRITVIKQPKIGTQLLRLPQNACVTWMNHVKNNFVEHLHAFPVVKLLFRKLVLLCRLPHQWWRDCSLKEHSYLYLVETNWTTNISNGYCS